MKDEQLLSGGNGSAPVTRRGATVRKPWSAATPSVHAFMTDVRNAGIDVPAILGRDKQGRQIMEFIPGRLALETARMTVSDLGRVGAIVRAIHDAGEGFVPADSAQWENAIPTPGSSLICHNDLAPWNLIVGERWTFIDWDGAGPSTRLWDLSYSAQAFTLNDPEASPDDAAADLAAFVNGYKADERLRDSLPWTMHQRAAAMLDLLRSSHASGREPWASMYLEGHGDHWARTTRYVERHQALWAKALDQR